MSDLSFTHLDPLGRARMVDVTAKDSSDVTYTKTMSLTVVAAVVGLPAVMPSGASFDGCTFGVPCSRNVVVQSGGVAPFAWAVTGLPAGMSMRTGDGVTSGNTTPGTSILQGIRNTVASSTTVTYNPTGAGIDSSYRAAIAVVGETPYAEARPRTSPPGWTVMGPGVTPASAPPRTPAPALSETPPPTTESIKEGAALLGEPVISVAPVEGDQRWTWVEAAAEAWLANRAIADTPAARDLEPEETASGEAVIETPAPESIPDENAAETRRRLGRD